MKLLAHIEEFESTRGDDEKIRQVLFPKEINSIFGVSPVDGFLLPMTEALEVLVQKLDEENKFITAVLDVQNPYIQICENDKYVKVFLNDTPRLRQLYYNYRCSRGADVRFGSLNYALKYIKSRKVGYVFTNKYNFREILINGIKMIFVYKYCLSETDLKQIAPEEQTVIVNLYNWNGECSISKKAYEFAERINVTLMTTENFHAYINKCKM